MDIVIRTRYPQFGILRLFPTFFHAYLLGSRSLSFCTQAREVANVRKFFGRVHGFCRCQAFHIGSSTLCQGGRSQGNTALASPNGKQSSCTKVPIGLLVATVITVLAAIIVIVRIVAIVVTVLTVVVVLVVVVVVGVGVGVVVVVVVVGVVVVVTVRIVAIIFTVLTVVVVVVVVGAPPPYQLCWLICPLPELWGGGGRRGDNCV